MRSNSYVYLASQPALEACQLGAQRVVIHGLVAHSLISQLLVHPGHGSRGRSSSQRFPARVGAFTLMRREPCWMTKLEVRAMHDLIA